MSNNAYSLGIKGTLRFVPIDPPRPQGKYVVQRCAPGTGNVAGDLDGSTQVRAHVLPGNPRSTAQMQQRGKMADAVRAWRALPEADRLALRAAADAAGLPPYHYFLSTYLASAAALDFTAWRTEWDGHKTEWDNGRTLWRTGWDSGNTIWF